MNLITTLKAWPLFAATPTDTSIPTFSEVTIPAGLDGEIKRKLNSVIVRTRKGLFCSFSRVEDLEVIAQSLGQEERLSGYTIRLYGHEIDVLYMFLWEQEKWRKVWWPVVFDYEDRSIVWRFLAQLRVLRSKVDVNASRPILAKG